jgi:2,4-dienoyl-CoA reductase-like NADH-dependent reductase (Old Yellow Enzyme family)
MWHPPERIKHLLPTTTWPTRDEAGRALLYQPFRVGALEIQQRTWVPAMVPWRATEDGYVTDDVVEWYRRFAQGEPGVIVVEATGIRDIPSGPLLRVGHARFIPGLARLCEAVREASSGKTRLFLQVIDFLRIRRRPSKGRFFESFLAIEARHRDAAAAVRGDDRWLSAPESELRAELAAMDDAELQEVLSKREMEDYLFGYRERIWDMHLPHIRELPRVLPDLFADAAHHAFSAGFDGVELHYAHAYTMASFLSALNTRQDGYGGVREQRARLPLEVIAAVRARVGASHVVGTRFLGDDVI